MKHLILKTNNYYKDREIFLRCIKLTDKAALFVLYLNIKGHTIIVEEQITCPIEMSSDLIGSLAEKVCVEARRVGL